MPYSNVADLPDSIRNNLPKEAQEVYVKAYNSAWEQYSDPDERRNNESREEVSHKVAWSAVKNRYRKNEEGRWSRKIH